jgi:hypothetical protein
LRATKAKRAPTPRTHSTVLECAREHEIEHRNLCRRELEIFRADSRFFGEQLGGRRRGQGLPAREGRGRPGKAVAAR